MWVSLQIINQCIFLYSFAGFSFTLRILFLPFESFYLNPFIWTLFKYFFTERDQSPRSRKDCSGGFSTRREPLLSERRIFPPPPVHTGSRREYRGISSLSWEKYISDTSWSIWSSLFSFSDFQSFRYASHHGGILKRNMRKTFSLSLLIGWSDNPGFKESDGLMIPALRN